MSDVMFTFLVFVGVFLFFRFIFVQMKRKSAGMGRQMTERMEALFRTGFPELQPHFHPEKVHEYAKARMARSERGKAFRWQNPPGFTLAAVADIQPSGAREKTRLLDKAGAVLSEFEFEEHAEGAALRVGKGKLTVGLKGPEPRVRYWHPEREFKWTPTSWKLKSGVAEKGVGSDDDDHDHSSDTSSSWDDRDSPSYSRTATAAAAGAAVGAAAAAGAGDDAPDFSSVSSGSSSTATSY